MNRRRSDNGRAARIAAFAAGLALALALGWRMLDSGPVAPAAPSSAVAAALAASPRAAPDELAQSASDVTERSATPSGAASTPEASILAPSASLGGVVLLPDGGPAVGIDVQCFAWPNYLHDVSEPCLARARTGADGRFEFSGATVSTGVLVVEHDEWPRLELGPRPLRAGDFVELQLERGWRLEGRVQHADGSPAAGARVLVAPARHDRLDGLELRALGVRECDEQGSFRTPTLPLRSVDVRIDAPRGSLELLTFAPVEAPLVFTLRQRVVVSGFVVDARERTPIAGAQVAEVHRLGSSTFTGPDGSFELEASEGTNELFLAASTHLSSRLSIDAGRGEYALAPRPRLFGSVLTADGRPAAGARLHLERSASERSSTSAQEDPRTPDLGAQADANGRFDWRAPLDGPSLVLSAELSASGLAVERLSTLKPGAERELKLVIASELGWWGVVRDERGAALVGVRVELFESTPAGAQGLLSNRPRVSAVSDSAGAYRLSAPAAGVWRVRVSASGYATAIETLSWDSAAAAVRRDFELRAGGLLSGRVVDESGAPLADVDVARVDELSAETRRTDREGRFEFASACSSGQTLAAHKDGWAPVVQRGVPVDAVALELVLERGRRLHGMVVDAQTGAPIQRFRVQRWAEDARSAADALALTPFDFESDDGAFELVGLVAGSYTLRVDARGYSPWEGEALRASEDGGGVLVRLERGATLVGQVREVRGGALARARVHVQRETDVTRPFERREAERARLSLRTVAVVDSDADGRFVFEGLALGSYVVKVECDGWSPVIRSVECGGSQRELKFELERAVSIRGRVWNSNGTPAVGATVFAHVFSSRSESSLVSAACDERGAFQLGGLQAGREVQIIANRARAGGGFDSGRLTVTPAESAADLTLTLERDPATPGR